MKETKIAIHNASPYARGGHVEMPWDGGDGDFEVAIGHERYPAQVDATQGAHGARTLSFTIDSLPSGTNSAVVRPRTREPEGATAAGERDGGIYLVNKHLDVWFSLAPERGGLCCFASSAPTVQVGHFEFLDTEGANKNAFRGHDPEKRAMQIDYVRLWRPPWDEHEPACCEFPLFNRPWTLVGAKGGPVRCWATLASPPIEFDVQSSSGGGRTTYNCTLYRTLSLYAGADYILEDLHLRGVVGEASSTDLSFAVQYFMSAQFSLRPKVVHYPEIPDWFGIGAQWDVPKFPGYGFGTNAHVTQVRNPPPAFPHPESEHHKAFTWGTEAARKIRCGHIFRLDTNPERMADEAGKFWYLHLLEPLTATTVGAAAGAERESA